MSEKLNDKILNKIREECTDKSIKNFLISILLFESDRTNKSPYKEKYKKELDSKLNDLGGKNEI